MIPIAKFYPELDGAQVEETITPLAEHDADITALLTPAAPSVSPPELDEDSRATVAEWSTQPEEHPFQRLVRAIAGRVLDFDPLGVHSDLFEDPRTALVEVLERAESRLSTLHVRPLVAALNRARENGVLLGDDPAARYTDFVERSLATSFHRTSGMGFPVLEDVTRIVLRNEAESTRETCARLAVNRKAIEAAFGIPADEPLSSLGAPTGDTHHHGRAVSVLTFASGTRLVYKPRDVSCESAYRDIASEFGTRLGTRLPSARVLERDGYGYVEFVSSEDVSDDLAGFMRASGELAAVLYLFDARDMHFENVVATRRGPLPIDLETLFHPSRIYAGATPEIPGNAHSVVGRSVYGTGLLPLVLEGRNPEDGHVDVGFLGGQGTVTSPFKTMRFEDAFTDRMRVVLSHGRIPERNSVVGTLDQKATQDLGDAMAEGFTRIYRAVLADPGLWRDLVRRVAERVRVRYVHNPTAVYGQTLRMTAGANPMDDPAVHTALLKRIAIPSRSSGKAIALSEMRQLAERDVPYFSVRATSTALEDGAGRPVGAEFTESPFKRALDKIAAMGEDDLSLQRALILSAFASRFPDNHLLSVHPVASWPEEAAEREPEDDIADLAGHLGDRLVASSLPDRFQHLPPSWVGPIVSARTDRPWPPGVLGYDLYTGRTGPALALAASAKVLNRPDHGELASRIFSSTAGMLADEPHGSRNMQRLGWNGYTGVASILFSLAAAGRLLDRPDWLRVAQESVPIVTGLIEPLSPRSVPLDVIEGLGGVLSGLSAVGGAEADAATHVLVDKLLAALADGGGRPTLDQSGFAHGVSGLLHTLSTAHPRLSQDRRIVIEAETERLLAQLGEFFVPEEGLWFSNMRTRNSFASGWCHGSAGIALGLDSLQRLTRDPGTRALRDLAVRNTLRDGFARNLTWCHGDLGNHAILDRIALADDDTELRLRLDAVRERWLNTKVLERKRTDDRSRYAHTSSLMIGTSGILLHLLYRIDPTSVPCPLTLTPGEHRAV